MTASLMMVFEKSIRESKERPCRNLEEFTEMKNIRKNFRPTQDAGSGKAASS
jgi:ribosomal protein S20